VAKAIFEEWICKKGVRKLLLSDNGKEFTNNIREELCTLMKIEKHLIISYHPKPMHKQKSSTGTCENAS
jgi:hypothetical protein